MAQFPVQGSARRDTIISDHQIEHITVTVSDQEGGRFELSKPHRFIPSVVFLDKTNGSNYHTNIYLTEITNVGQFATGSITIAGGTTALDLNGDKFTLIDKNSKSKEFTFNNTDNVLTDGSIGLQTAADEATILSRTKTSINNIAGLEITAKAITAGTATKSFANDILSLGSPGGNNGNSDGDDFTINVPASIGGSGVAITVRLVPNLSSSPGANQVFVVRATANNANRTRIVAAFNGADDPGYDASKIEYGAGVTGASTGIQGMDAGNGSNDTLVSLQASQTGIAGNSIVVANVTGTIFQSVSFSGGGTQQTLEVVQNITGSTGNTVIDMSSVTNVSSVNFVDGNNYGSGSFTSSESFTGDVRIRAASLQNEYLM